MKKVLFIIVLFTITCFSQKRMNVVTFDSAVANNTQTIIATPSIPTEWRFTIVSRQAVQDTFYVYLFEPTGSNYSKTAVTVDSAGVDNGTVVISDNVPKSYRIKNSHSSKLRFIRQDGVVTSGSRKSDTTYIYMQYR